ncbi:hypothetical protein EAW52_20325 [Pseudomonas sp. LTJR-52]|nr:hypothetical protein EAW52_20325 [Pseudomonas sp. LTJR-52]
MMSDHIHLWLGNNFQPEEEYMKYFEKDYSTGGYFDDPGFKVCGFCKDIGHLTYDEDYIAIIPRKEKPVPIDDWLKEAYIDDSEHARIKLICERAGLKEANTMLIYSDGDLSISEPYKENYNKLIYIGKFLES